MHVNHLLAVVLAAAVTWSLPLRAQQQPAIGFLTSGSLASLNKQWLAAFHRGLSDSGFVEGQNVTIFYRAAEDLYDRLPDLAAELVRDQVATIVAAGGPVSALAAKKATNTIPIVFTTIADPVKSGLVSSFNRPDGNATGTAGLTSELDVKRLELLHQTTPNARVVGILANPNRPGVEAQLVAVQSAARAIGCELVVERAGDPQAIDTAFEKFAEQRADALVVTADPLFNFRRAQVITLAQRYAIPAIYQWREFVADGGLMSYGPSIAEAYHQAGVYAGRILKGARPADLPVVQPTRFELVVNLRVAKALGLELPPSLLATANAVLE